MAKFVMLQTAQMCFLRNRWDVGDGFWAVDYAVVGLPAPEDMLTLDSACTVCNLARV